MSKTLALLYILEDMSKTLALLHILSALCPENQYTMVSDLPLYRIGSENSWSIKLYFDIPTCFVANLFRTDKKAYPKRCNLKLALCEILYAAIF